MTSYLDYAGIGVVRPAARAAMRHTVDAVLPRGSAEYGQFFTARTAAREAGAALLDCHPDEVALVANTSAGLQLVADGLAWRVGDEVVVFERDFPANVQPWRRLRERGIRLRWVPMRDGRYELDDVASAIGAATRLVALSHVHFVTGFRIDLDAVCTLAKPYGALVCVDAVQSLGVVPMSLSRTPVDFAVAGAHKWLCAPPGTGLFFCRRERLEMLGRAPLGWFGYDGSDRIFGHGEGQLVYDLPPRPAARRFEGGMLNFVGIAGMAAALDEIVAVGAETIWERVRSLTATLREGLSDLGYAGGDPSMPAAGIVSFAPHRGRFTVDAARLQADLALRDCHCSNPDGHIRLSPHYWTTADEVGLFLDALRTIVSEHSS